MSTPASTLSADQMEALTGLTERRLRQLAKAGYFPPPVRAQYQQAPTIRGLFKYYREDHNQAAKTLNGAKLTKLKADAEMARIKLAEAKREVIDRDLVANYLKSWVAKLDLLLTAELENNLPTALIGQPIDLIRSEMRNAHDRIREATRRGLRAWEDANPVLDDLPPEDADQDQDGVQD
jgi:phage terminase Nu1 subunit (DNA packaging protein)